MEIIKTMIRISVNVLTAIQMLMSKSIKYEISNEEGLWSANSSQIDTAWLIETAHKCNWIDRNNKMFQLTDRGYSLFADERVFNKLMLRDMLYDYITSFHPVWSYKIPIGRSEAIFIMTEDEKACFFEAGLLDENPDHSIVEWWDKLSLIIRKSSDERKSQIGRKGERLTILNEVLRTGVQPHWISIDSNLAGYDVLSQVSIEDTSVLLIESKASEANIEGAFCHITANEWHTAKNSKHYKFYFWLIGANNKLAMLDPIQIEPYIPTNNATGKWKNVKIPFSSFSEQFQNTNIKDGDLL